MKNLKPVTCKNCGHVRTPRVKNPKRCVICLSYKWNKENRSGLPCGCPFNDPFSMCINQAHLLKTEVK